MDDIEIFEDGSPDHSSEALIHTTAETVRMVSLTMVVLILEGVVLGSNLMDMLLVIIGSSVLMWVMGGFFN